MAFAALADVDQLQLPNEVVLVVLGLEEQPRRNVLEPDEFHYLEATDVTLAVREMQPGEADVVTALLLEANREHFDAFPDAVAQGYRSELADVAARLPASAILVAESAGAIVGVAALLRDAADDSHPWPPGGAILRLLAVAPAARGEGIGTLLSLRCLERARDAGASFVGLHTSPFMVAARSVYERLGFQRAPEHDFDPEVHYGGGEKSAEPWGLAYVLELRGDLNR